MTDWLRRLDFMREAGDVTRLHTVRTVRHHTVAVHTYGAICIAVELTQLNGLGRDDALRIFMSLLAHDAPELETGDVPAPVKRADPVVKQVYERLESDVIIDYALAYEDLTGTARDIAKAADCLDLGWAAVEERSLGNFTPRVRRVLDNILKYTEAQLHIKGVPELRAYLATSWIALETKHG